MCVYMNNAARQAADRRTRGMPMGTAYIAMFGARVCLMRKKDPVSSSTDTLVYIIFIV